MDHRMVSKKGGGIYEGGRGCEGDSIYEGGRVFIYMRVVFMCGIMVAGYLARRVAGWWIRDEGGIFSDAAVDVCAGGGCLV